MILLRSSLFNVVFFGLTFLTLLPATRSLTPGTQPFGISGSTSRASCSSDSCQPR